jgi:hypothetical protein
MNFLEAAKELIEETGIAGGDPDALETVVGQTGDLANAVRWIRESATQIDNLWFDWKYLWFEHSENLSVNQQNAVGPAFTVRRWDRRSAYINKFTGQPARLTFEEWEIFRQRTGAVKVTMPTVFTVLPNNTLRFNSKASQAAAFSVEGWRRPVILADDDDVPLMPSEFHRIIVVRGMIAYANKNDAPEVLEGAEAEYVDILEKLQADQAPAFEFERMSQADEHLGITVPGHEEAVGFGTTR